MADEDIVVVLELFELDGGCWAKFNSPAIGQTKVRLDNESLVALRARLESVESSVLSSSAQVLRRRADPLRVELRPRTPYPHLSPKPAAGADDRERR